MSAVVGWLHPALFVSVCVVFQCCSPNSCRLDRRFGFAGAAAVLMLALVLSFCRCWRRSLLWIGVSFCGRYSRPGADSAAVVLRVLLPCWRWLWVGVSFCRCCCRAGAGAGPAFCLAGAGAVLALVQALALDRRFLLRHARDDVRSCQR